MKKIILSLLIFPAISQESSEVIVKPRDKMMSAMLSLASKNRECGSLSLSPDIRSIIAKNIIEEELKDIRNISPYDLKMYAEYARKLYFFEDKEYFKEIFFSIFKHNQSHSNNDRKDIVERSIDFINYSGKGESSPGKNYSEYISHLGLNESSRRAFFWTSFFKGYDVLANNFRNHQNEFVNEFDEEDNNLFLTSAEEGNLIFLEKLLRFGSNIDLVDRYGDTALTLAAEKGHEEIVENLLNSNPNVNIQNYLGSETALILAAKKRHTNIVNILLAKNADMNIQNDFGNTALMVSLQKGNIEIANILLDNNADATLIRNSNGKTAFDIANEMGYTDFADKISDLF